MGRGGWSGCRPPPPQRTVLRCGTVRLTDTMRVKYESDRQHLTGIIDVLHELDVPRVATKLDVQHELGALHLVDTLC